MKATYSLIHPSLTYTHSLSKDGNMDYRYGAHDEVQEHRQRFLAHMHVAASQCVVMDSTAHGTTIQVVGATAGGRGVTDDATRVLADVLITTEPRVHLLLLTADCIPLTLFDPVQRVLALLHVGWRGANADIIARTIQKLASDFAVDPKNLIAIIGPAIHKESYFFTDTTALTHTTWASHSTQGADTLFAIDLVGFAQEEMERAGIPRPAITLCPIDTARDVRFFSHRRSMQTGEAEGRFVTVAAIT